MDDEQLLCTAVSAQHRDNCRRLIPHLRQWCHENAGRYQTAQQAVEPCKFVMTTILVSLLITVVADVLSGFILAWLEKRLQLAVA